VSTERSNEYGARIIDSLETGSDPQRIGGLPPQLAALIMTNVNVQSLAVEAALTGKREHVYHAATLDPHTAAELRSTRSGG